MRYPTALVVQDARRAVRFIRIRRLRPLLPCHISGSVMPCRCTPGDNLALHRAVMTARAGMVIVCDAQGRDDVAYFGELMARDCMRRKIAGLVIHGAVRDSDALIRLGFPVFCTALCPLPPVRRRVGSVARPITLGGARVAAGDQIIADRDGILLVSADEWLTVLSAMKQVQARERETRRRMRAGESLAGILGLKSR
jgi:4-hydroxy-4-methyl-2-oxoglutarate aldolase